MASTEVEPPSQPPKYKTWILRVSIHCQGCKRKVQKLLQSVPGVHGIEIETKRQRVVVTGDVLPESLIRKLVKSGKHAELWPENPPEIHTRKIEKPPGNTQGNKSEESAVTVKESKPPASKTEIPTQDPSKASSSAVPGGGSPAGNDGGKVDEGAGKRDGGKVAVDVKVEEKKPETVSAGNQAAPPAVDKNEKQTEKSDGVVAGDGGGGEGKKKKKKKPQNSNQNGAGETSSARQPVVGNSGEHGGGPPPTAVRSNQSPPRHHGYQYPPPHYYTPPPAPVYTVSYNTAHPPVNSYTASYYAAAPPQSYAYSHFSSERAPPPPYVPSDYESYTQQPVDSFEMFSDENPNGCLVM